MEFLLPHQRDICLILLAYTANPSQSQSKVWTHLTKLYYFMNTSLKFNVIDDHGHFIFSGKLNSVMTKMNMLERKGDSFAHGVREHGM